MNRYRSLAPFYGSAVLFLLLSLGVSAEPRYKDHAFFIKAPDGRRVQMSFHAKEPTAISGVLRIEWPTGPTLVADVIHPQSLPAGRFAVERFSGDTGVAFVVHRINGAGVIYDSVHSMGGYQMGTIKPSFTHYVFEDDTITWFELWDPAEGLGLPLSYSIWKRREEIPKTFLGTVGVFYGKSWVSAQPNNTGPSLESALSTYRVPERLVKPGFYAYKWSTPDGHRWAFSNNSVPGIDQLKATQSQARYRHFRALEVDWPSAVAVTPLYSPFFSELKIGNYKSAYNENAVGKGYICLAQREDKRFDLLATTPEAGAEGVEVLATIDKSDDATIQAALAPLRKLARARNKALALNTPSQEDLLNEHYANLGGDFLEYYDRKLSQNDFASVEYDINQETFDPKSRLWVRTYVVLRKPELIPYQGLVEVKHSGYPLAVEAAALQRVEIAKVEIARQEKRLKEIREQELRWQWELAERQRRASNAPVQGSSGSSSSWWTPHTHPEVKRRYDQAVQRAAEQERVRIRDAQW